MKKPKDLEHRLAETLAEREKLPAPERHLPFPKLLQYLIRVLDREIGTTGLDTPAGQEAAIAREIIRATLENVKDREKMHEKRN